MANDNQVWYDEIIRKASRRSSGMNEIAEANPLDWQRLRVLENGKFVPAMAQGHSGTPGIIDLDLLRDAAEKGNLFLYRLGEEYPMQLREGVWYSTDPAAAQEEKPEVRQDNAAQIAEWEKRTRFYGSLGTDVKRAIRDEMAPRREEIRKHQEKQRAFVLDKQPLVNWYNNDFSRAAFQPGKGPETVGNALDWSQYRIWDGKKFANAMPEGHKGAPDLQGMERLREAAQKGNLFFYRNGDEYPQRWENGVWYDTSPAVAAEKKPEVQQGQEEQIRAWEKRVGYYDGMSDEHKRAIQNEVAHRREGIRAYQARQHAAMESQPLGHWYNNEFRRNIMQPSNDPDLLASDGMDWSRIRIWDGQKFARVVPEGQRGVPDTQTLKNLKEAVQKGNLFMYQRGDKYPSKWMGGYWNSMDKGWIDRNKPEEPKPLPDKPVKPNIKEPTLEDATSGVSKAKLRMNRAFARVRINVYKGEAEKYKTAVADYEKEKAKYDKTMADYQKKLDAYDTETKARQSAYSQRLGAYQRMLRGYEGLSAAQRTAMEQDVQQRTEEIKNNKEVEKKIAGEKLSRERDTKIKIADAEARIAAMGNLPEQEAFLQGVNPLGQDAYNKVAPHGYALHVDAKITPNEVSSLHVVLAGSRQAAANGGLSPMNAQEYGQMLDGVLYGDPKGVNWQYITASYDAAQGLITAFESGDPKPLADALSEGVRNLMSVSKGRLDMSPEMAGLAKLTERIFQVMDAHKELLDHSTLNAEEMNFARGMVNLGKIYNNYIDARMELTMMSSGAQKLSPEQVNEHTANLLIGKMTESRLQKEQQGLAKPQMLEALGKGNGKAINVVQFAYRNNPAIQKFAADPQTQKQTDLDKRAQGLAHLFGTTVLAKPKESQQLREKIMDRVKELAEQNSPQAEEKRNLAEQQEDMERRQVRELLAQQDEAYRAVSLRSPVVTEKLKELREAREALEKQAERTRKEGEPATLYELTDPAVQKEALERASVRELMQEEKAALRARGKTGPEINDFTVSRRIAELRAAQKQLAGEQEFALTSKEVVEKAAENRALRAEQLRKPVTELLQAQKIYTEETGIQPKPNEKPPLYRSEAVQNRLKQLKAAQEVLRKAGENLEIDDMKVIQQDYLSRGIDPMKNGIVDVNSLTEAQKKAYTDRMEAIEFLRNVRGVEGLYKNKDRYHGRVDNAVSNLNRARETYELFVQGAETGLPLNHPKIAAMYLYNFVSNDSPAVKKVKFEEVEQFAQNMQGKNFDQLRAMAGQQMDAVRIREQQIQAENQQRQQQIINAM